MQDMCCLGKKKLFFQKSFFWFFLLSFSTLLIGCSEKEVNICSDKETIKRLSYDFGYEIAANSKLPQIEFTNMHKLKDMNSVAWCQARASVKGSADELTSMLIAKLGSKNWQSRHDSLYRVDPTTLSATQIDSLYSYLAVFYLLRYKNTVNQFHEYDVSMQVVYTVNKIDGILVGIDYDHDIFRLIFKEISNDIESSRRDLPVISVMRR
jgi:hypothetical protein